MKTREGLIAGGKRLAEVKIQRGIFQKEALSPLICIIAMITSIHIHRKYTGSCKLNKSQEISTT